jgi:hypothetical protein
MTKPIQLGQADYFRGVSKEARAVLRNRYFESNPVLTQDPVALIARPGERRALSFESGPVRQVYTCPGAFSDDLFAVSDLVLYRVSRLDLAVTALGQIGNVVTDRVNMAATANIGTTPGHLFVADGGVLWCYTEDGYASANLTATGAIVNNDTVTLDTTVYKWTSGSVDAGTPAGTIANPWLVAPGASTPEALDNLFHAVNSDGTPGTTYSTVLTANPTIAAYSLTASKMYVRAIDSGAIGNAKPVTETGANIAWNAGTLAGGGLPSLFQVPTPDDVGVISLAHIDQYVIIIPTQGQGVNGRFYWINPGETTIDPLNFATAERAPDAVFQVIVFSDQFWLLGQSTVEPWYMTGNLDAPVLRTQGILFDRGTWEGTGIQVKDSLILVDPDGGVFQIAGGVKRISTPDISERIRRAIKTQAQNFL